jgi:RND family efflux transporter MFP subunit
VRKIALLFSALPVIVAAIGCRGAEETTKEPAAAVVDNRVTEPELTTIRLSPRAEERIGIELGSIESKSVARTRQLGGELIVPPGSSVTVTAPKAATILAPEAGRIPAVGARVRKEQPLLRLVVLPAEGDMARAREEVAVAEARLTNARHQARRAEELFEQGVGSEKASQDANEELIKAEAVLRTAQAQLDVLLTGQTRTDPTDLTPITLTAPERGVIRQVLVSAGQTVSDGTALMEIVKVNPLWVRVPVYVGDISKIDSKAQAWISDPGASSGGERFPATPLPSVPTADAASSSADLYYRVANPGEILRPGQRVRVALALEADASGLVVPWSAVLHDIYGGTWVYESLGDQVYIRRRVEVKDVVDDYAVLSRGPAAGTKVVVVGAAELFSTEFSTSK